jgi:hypothetical protein
VDWKLPTLVAALWVVALTVGGVALGVLIAGSQGVLIGAIPLALGTVLAGYLPAIRDAVHRRARSAASSPPPSGYLMHPAYRRTGRPSPGQ